MVGQSCFLGYLDAKCDTPGMEDILSGEGICTGSGVPAEKIPRNLSSVGYQLGGEYIEGSARLGGDIALPVLH